MGALESKPIHELSTKDISIAVANLGVSYKPYCKNIVEHGVDGKLLDSLESTEIAEKLDHLLINNRLHRRVLSKEIIKAKRRKDFLASAYDYNPDTPLSDLRPYQEVTRKCLQQNIHTAILAGVHLILENGNQLSLDTKILRDGTVVMENLHRKKGVSLCSSVVGDGSNQAYYKLLFPIEIQRDFIDDSSSLTYTGYVLTDESSRRVGIVCMLDRCHPSQISDLDREAFLRRMAFEIEYQLFLRKQYIERQNSPQDHSGQSLQSSVVDCCANGNDIVLPAHGPIKEVNRTQVAQRISEGNPFQFGSAERASHTLPIFQNLSTEAEQAHLSLDFFECVDALSSPRPPIAKNDMECTALVEALSLTDIDPDDAIALYLRDMVKMATQVFGFPNAEITFRNHNTIFGMAEYGTNEEITKCAETFPTIKRNKDGSRFLWKMPRALAICNYVMAVNRTFVVQDIAEDKSFQWLISGTPCRSYVGTAIKDSCGRSIAVLCMHDDKPRPDFEAAHEIQIEQLASLISQSIENWALKRSIERLNSSRRLIDSGRDKQRPPRQHVTLVVTDIEGCINLWEANSSMMQRCQQIHDEIIKEVCTKHFGHEVEIEGNSFVLAFHDPVDAFGFALDAQLALYEARWPDDVLRSPYARHEVDAFRGPRVKMAIHEGSMGSFKLGENEQFSYDGETLTIAKNLVMLAKGGQILSTAETWDVASYFMGSMLSFPQVLDHGSHVIPKGQTTREGVITKRIIQLVPSKLAYDYFTARKLSTCPEQERHHDGVNQSYPGRHFPPIMSLKKVSPSFHDAPFIDNEVTMAFINLSNITDDEASSIAYLIGTLLDGRPEFGGYQCQSEMLVFHRPIEAVIFGLYLQKEISNRQARGGARAGLQLVNQISYACIHENFLTMGPHRTTGRADYFGKIVNRAARLCKVVAMGSVCFGVVHDDNADNMDERAVDSISHPSIKFRFGGTKKLKGVPEEVSVYECRMRSNCNHLLHSDGISK